MALLARGTELFVPELVRSREAALVVLIADAAGLLVAVRDPDHGVGPSDVVDGCTALLEASPIEGAAWATVVSRHPGFADCTPMALKRMQRDLTRRFEEAGTTLFDWILVSDDATRSLAPVDVS